MTETAKRIGGALALAVLLAVCGALTVFLSFFL